MVRVGSARSNESGGINGGKPGDQAGGAEVSTQAWYLHPKGWKVVRAKDASVREKIAKNMEAGCANNHIGYCQTHRTTATEAAKAYGYDLSRVTKDVEVDCSELVRICCLYAGVTVATFNTASEASVLKATGKFEVLTDDKYCKSSDYLLRGDILVTKTKGHTVVVLDDGAKASESDGSASADKVDPARSFDKSLAGTYKVTASALHIRAGAGTAKKSLGTLPNGTKAQCYGYYTLVSGTKWLLVVAAGKTGFCSIKYLKKG